MMNLRLERIQRDDVCTIGQLLVDGTFECWTLEDVVRADGIKIPGETAIPRGLYSVDITHSPKFNRDLPLLLNVAGFVGIRIHPGNTAGDTEGCILVGKGREQHRILESKAAFDTLFAKLQSAKAAGKSINMVIVDA